MKTRLLLLAAIFCLTVSEASAYRRSNRSGYGGYGGYGNMAGGYLAGLGMYTSALGSSAVNYQQAYQHYLENRKLKAQTFFDLRRMNASYRAEQAMLHPPPTAEEIAAFNQARLPQPLSANVFDPGHGVIEWPPLLRRSEFDDSRHQVEGLFAEWAADPHGSGLGTENCRNIQQAVSALKDKLHSQIKQFGPDEYIAASKFLKSLAFQARSPSGNTLVSK